MSDENTTPEANTPAPASEAATETASPAPHTEVHHTEPAVTLPETAPEAHTEAPHEAHPDDSASVPETATEPPSAAPETHAEPDAAEIAPATGESITEGTGEHAPATEAKPKKPRKPKAAAPAASAVATPTDPGAGPSAAESADAEPAAADAAVAVAEAPPENKKKWYAVKVQSGREESIKAAVERKVKIEGLEEFFGQIIIPVEEVVVKKKVKLKNKKTGETTTQEKNVSKFNKKYPGYLFTEVEFNDQILYVFRETSGVGDFVGISGKRKPGSVEPQTPTPLPDDEVHAILTGIPAAGGRRKAGQPSKVLVKLDFEKGDKVRIKNGAFLGSEGEVKAITTPKDPTETPKVTVVVTFWGRPLDLEVDYWEVDKM